MYSKLTGPKSLQDSPVSAFLPLQVCARIEAHVTVSYFQSLRQLQTQVLTCALHSEHFTCSATPCSRSCDFLKVQIRSPNYCQDACQSLFLKPIFLIIYNYEFIRAFNPFRNIQSISQYNCFRCLTLLPNLLHLFSFKFFLFWWEISFLFLSQKANKLN